MDADGLDPLLHQPARGRIMAYLYRNRQARLTTLAEALGLTKGNLQSHAQKLESAGYVEARRALAQGLEVRYYLTNAGAEAFREYVRRLQALIGDAGL